MKINKKTILRIISVTVVVLLFLVNVVVIYAGSLIGRITEQADFTMTDSEIEELLREELIDASEVSASDILSEEEQALLDQNVANSAIDSNGLYSEKGVTNILLLGVDTRSQHSVKGRTDVIMVASINQNLKQLSMVSIMRDSYVSIPGKSPDKINAAYVYGGPELAIDTVEGAFGIKIDKYVVINFYAFIDIVDYLGGITLDHLSYEEMQTANRYINAISDLNGWNWKANQIKHYGDNIHLTGVQAMGYVRNRYSGNGEYQRTQRQRTVLTKILEKLKDSDVLSLLGVLDIISENMSTDYTSSQIVDLATKAPEYLSYDIVQSRLPVEGSYKAGMGHGAWIIEMDFAVNRQHIIDFIYGTKSASEKQ